MKTKRTIWLKVEAEFTDGKLSSFWEPQFHEAVFVENEPTAQSAYALGYKEACYRCEKIATACAERAAQTASALYATGQGKKKNVAVAEMYDRLAQQARYIAEKIGRHCEP